MADKCPICYKKSHELVRGRVNGESKGQIKTKVWRCRDCELDFLETWDDSEYIKSLYEGANYVYSANISNNVNIPLKYNEYEERLKKMKPFLNKDHTLLEIGSGDGTFLRMVSPYVAVAEGVELSPIQAERLRKEGFTIYDTIIDEVEPVKSYNIVCMFQLLEHVPNVTTFLECLKKYLSYNSMIFIEVPNLNCPLLSCYDIPGYRDMQYRIIHQYYFTLKALGKLLEKCSYGFEIRTLQQASITNHFHWMYTQIRQPTKNHMSSAVLPVPYFSKGHIDSNLVKDVLEVTDNFYRQMLEKRDLGNLIYARAWLKNMH